MKKDNFEFVKEFSCACGKTHNTQVDDVIIEKGAIKRVPEVIARYGAKKRLFLQMRIHIRLPEKKSVQS